MEQRVPLPRPAKDFNTAKRMYMEQFGSALVTNNYLKVALARVSLVAVGLIVLNIRTYQTFENFKPLVIRISDVGRAAHSSLCRVVRIARVRFVVIPKPQPCISRSSLFATNSVPYNGPVKKPKLTPTDRLAPDKRC